MTKTALSELPKAAAFTELRSELKWAYDDEVATRFLSGYLPASPIVAWMIRSGGVLVRQGNSTVSATPGNWLFPACRSGWQRFIPGTKLLSVRFMTRWLDDRRPLFNHSRAVVIPSVDAPELERTGAELAAAVRAFAGPISIELHSKEIDVEAHFMIQMRFHAWLGAYTHAMRTVAELEPQLPVVRNRQAIAALRLIEDHPLNQPLREQEIANRLEISVSWLNRLFSQHFDSTPKRWFDARREQYAINALIHSDAQVKSIAFALGFMAVPHFSRWFRRQTGQPPLKYRQSRRQGIVVVPADNGN